jgi:exodeoxyribonuclease V alpha subunit
MLRGWSVGKPQPERENLAGLVERVTFHNEESGFSVLRVEARGQRDLITVVGHAATIGAGEFVQASGRWVNDRTHGVQFRADLLRRGTADGGRGHREVRGVADVV